MQKRQPSMKGEVVLAGVQATAGATVTAMIDTLGANWLTLDVVGSTVAAATNRPSVFKLGESDTPSYTAAVDLPRAVGDGAGGWTIPNWPTQAADLRAVKMTLDLRARKRYLFLAITPRTTQSFVAIANMAPKEASPLATAAAANVLALVEG